ncbi:spermidine/putrescine ABC transporter substrate-binding protein [Vibrio ostreicida]|uniref:Spermidine/putrescine ABC transporter substrate-binding protein n=1 Tax=Vibrio ostreicida TaxID=526588 RepID=A0ABT8BUP3_9VIBR|nr:spermidine/putrescine ABC transporter substrate-binding protein [Vibrio ostreicida]MDN3610886.1 spermidine/putrescine ABC transporter substrate-binding protein [Vibrio ostreicida]NPD10468.1 spermidine/putrescine ABC transporter substrate-binding protein [Vibrio ostreicida]
MRLNTLVIAVTFIHSFAAHSAESLNIYMWEDTLSQNVVDNWHKESPTQLKFSHFDNDDERSLLMMKSVQLPFDIVILDNVSANIYGRQGAFEDLSQLENRHHNDKKWLQACGNHAIPYFWGTVGIAYRQDLVGSPPKTWRNFVNPPKDLEGKIGMINDSIESFLPVFYSLNISPTEDDERLLQRAYPALQAFNDKILTYEYILSYIRSHEKADKLAMALAYSGDQYSLNRFYEEQQWHFIAPEGELFLWVDCLAINSHSQNKTAAKAFLEYLMDPKIAAINAKDIKAATPNLTALKLVPDWYKNDASLFPEKERVEQGRVDSELSASNISLRAKIINRILKRHEAQH